MSGKTTSRTKLFALTAAVFAVVAAFFPQAASAVGTLAGTSITNQATATYQDASATSFTATSNTTTVTVTSVFGVAITTPADLPAASGTTVYYAYTLTNPGNDNDTYTLTAASVPAGWTATLYADDGAGGGVKDDGIHQAGETTVIASTGVVAPDNTYKFFMAVAVPAGTANGTTAATTLTVTGTGDATAVDDASDAVTTTAQAPSLLVQKDVRNATTGGAFAGTASAAPAQVLEYRLTATNNGSAAATSVTLSDPLNANTGFIVGSAAFNTAIVGFTAVTEYSNNGGTSWAYAPANGGCAAPAGADYCVTNIRWRSTAGSMPSGGSTFTSTFQVRVK